jgi:hypothetical protein
MGVAWLGATAAVAVLAAEPATDAGQEASRDAESGQTVIRLQPRVRSRDRGADFFQRLPCGKLDSTPVFSRQEARWLAQRREACLRYWQRMAK